MTGWWWIGLALLALLAWATYNIGRDAEHHDLMERAEVRWWCRFDNEFGPPGRAHPYCYPRHMAGARQHLSCGWGTWTPRYTRHGMRL